MPSSSHWRTASTILGSLMLVAVWSVGRVEAAVPGLFSIRTNLSVLGSGTFFDGVNLKGKILDFNQGSSRIYDNGDLRVVTDNNLFLNAPNTVVTEKDLQVNGRLTLANGGVDTGSKMYDDGDLRVKTDDTMYLDAQTVVASRNLSVTGRLNGLGGLYGSLTGNVTGNLTGDVDADSVKVGEINGVVKATDGVLSGSATTTDLPEGENLYFTDERVDDRVGSLLIAGTGINLAYADGGNSLTVTNTDLGSAAVTTHEGSYDHTLLHSPVTIGTANGLGLVGQVLSMDTASGSTIGSLTATDWNTFNNKEEVLTFSGGVSRAANVVTVDTIQNITNLSNLTTNGFVVTTGGDGTLGVDTSTYLTGNETITLSGDVTGSGATAITTTIGSGKVTNDMLAGSISAAKLVGTDISTVGTITSGTWNGLSIGDTYIASSTTWNGKVDPARAVSAGTGLTGGGDLSADRTFSVTGSLATLYGLPDGAGWLKNDGAGSFSWATPTPTDIGLGNVENTALSTWAGTGNITTLGTITSGTWNAGSISTTGTVSATGGFTGDLTGNVTGNASTATSATTAGSATTATTASMVPAGIAPVCAAAGDLGTIYYDTTTKLFMGCAESVGTPGTYGFVQMSVTLP